MMLSIFGGVASANDFTDASAVDFRVPENYYHDHNSVAGLLKQFFRDLPDPLLTNEHYDAFIKAAGMFYSFELKLDHGIETNSK